MWGLFASTRYVEGLEGKLEEIVVPEAPPGEEAFFEHGDEDPSADEVPVLQDGGEGAAPECDEGDDDADGGEVEGMGLDIEMDGSVAAHVRNDLVGCTEEGRLEPTTALPTTTVSWAQTGEDFLETMLGQGTVAKLLGANPVSRSGGSFGLPFVSQLIAIGRSQVRTEPLRSKDPFWLFDVVHHPFPQPPSPRPAPSTDDDPPRVRTLLCELLEKRLRSEAQAGSGCLTSAIVAGIYDCIRLRVFFDRLANRLGTLLLHAFEETAKLPKAQRSAAYLITRKIALWGSLDLRNDLAVISAYLLAHKSTSQLGDRKLDTEDLVKELAFGVGDVFAARSLPPWERARAEGVDIPLIALPVQKLGNKGEEATFYLGGVLIHNAHDLLVRWATAAGKTIRKCLKENPEGTWPSKPAQKTMAAALAKLHVTLMLMKVVSSGLLTLPRATFRVKDPRSAVQKMQDKGGLMWPASGLKDIIRRMLDKCRQCMAFAREPQSTASHLDDIMKMMLSTVGAESASFVKLVTTPIRAPVRTAVPDPLWVAHIGRPGYRDPNPDRWGPNAFTGSSWLADDVYEEYAAKLFKPVATSLVNSKRGQLLAILQAAWTPEGRAAQSKAKAGTRTALAHNA